MFRSFPHGTGDSDLRNQIIVLGKIGNYQKNHEFIADAAFSKNNKAEYKLLYIKDEGGNLALDSGEGRR